MSGDNGGEQREKVKFNLDKTASNFASIFDFIRLLKNNIESFFELKDLIEERRRIEAIKEMLVRLSSLHHIRSSFFLRETFYEPEMFGYYDIRRMRIKIAEVEDLVNELTRLFEDKLEGLVYYRPDLVKRITIALEGKLLIIERLSEITENKAKYSRLGTDGSTEHSIRERDQISHFHEKIVDYWNAINDELESLILALSEAINERGRRL